MVWMKEPREGLRAWWIVWQEKRVTKKTAPSTLSQMASSSLAPWVLMTWDFYLSQRSSDKFTKPSGSFLSSSISLGVVRM